jgi:hypothetical protein
VQLKQHQRITFSERLAQVLSLPKNIEFSSPGRLKQVFKSRTRVDPWRNFHHLFIYSDIVADCIVNQTTKPLLQTVNISYENFGNLSVRTFYPPDYIKLRYDHYSTLNFQIKDESGEFVRFRSGSVVLKLLLRQDHHGDESGSQ